MNNKGQSALEYLMTYGWALVVIVIVVAALFAFGVFNTPANCTQFGGRLLLKDYSITATGITLAIQNGGTGEMTSLSAGGTGTCTVTSSTSLARSATTSVTCSDATIASGSTNQVWVKYTLNSIDHNESTTCVAGSV